MIYPWFEDNWHKINQAFITQRDHHALLFNSEPGLDTEGYIQQLAQGILCRVSPGIEYCGYCPDCQLFASENHSDFHQLKSSNGKQIGVDEVRDIILKLQHYAQQDGRRVIYIDNIGKLNEASGNALLKTLEEPGDNNYFILHSESGERTLATIHSRCQTWNLKAPNHRVAFQWLISQNIADEKSIEIALRMNFNRPFLAKRAVESGWIEARIQFLRQFWKFYEMRQLITFVDCFALTDKQLLLRQVFWLEAFLQDALKAKMNIQNNWLNSDITKGINLFSQQNSRMQIITAIELTQNLRKDLLTINAVNEELMVCNTLTKFIIQVFEKNDC